MKWVRCLRVGGTTLTVGHLYLVRGEGLDTYLLANDDGDHFDCDTMNFEETPAPMVKCIDNDHGKWEKSLVIGKAYQVLDADVDQFKIQDENQIAWWRQDRFEIIHDAETAVNAPVNPVVEIPKETPPVVKPFDFDTYNSVLPGRKPYPYIFGGQ